MGRLPWRVVVRLIFAPASRFAPMIALLPPMAIVLTWTVDTALEPLESQFPPIKGLSTSLFFAFTGVFAILFATLLAGFAWPRVPLVVLLWVFLGVQLASFPPLFLREGPRALLFLLVIAADVAALSMLYGTRFRTALRDRVSMRKSRLPDGSGLVIVANAPLALGVPLALVLLALDIRYAGGPDWLPETWLGRRAVPALGVVIALVIMNRVQRSRAPLYWAHGLCLLVAGANLLLVIADVSVDGSSSMGPFVVLIMAMPTIGLFAATRPGFKRYWTLLQDFDRLHASQRVNTPVMTNKGKNRRRHRHR